VPVPRGREKALRKVAFAVLSSGKEIESSGDWLQTGSFTYVFDCVEGMQRLTASDIRDR
jgi:GDP-D-mannose 3', 5'-epimerase